MSASIRIRLPLALALVACGCQSFSSESRASAPAVERFPSFPGEAVAGDVIVEARFYRDHAAAIGIDVTREMGVLPIALRLGLAPGAKTKVRFGPEAAELRLILADGTELKAVAPTDAHETDVYSLQRASAAAAEASWLGDWSRADDEFVYFLLEPAEDFFLRGTQIRHRSEGVVRKLDIDRSLLAFDIEVDGVRRPVRVGVKLDNAVKFR